MQTPESVQTIPRGVPARSREDNISEGAGVQMEHKQKTAQVYSISTEHISSRNERSIYARPSQTYRRPCVKRLDSEQGLAARFMSDVYRAPRDVDPEESADFRQALAAGEPIIIWIDHTARLQEFSSFIAPGVSSVASEHEFLKIVVNVLHLLLTSNGVGLDDSDILRAGVKCYDNQVQGEQHAFCVLFPTGNGSIELKVTSELMGRTHLPRPIDSFSQVRCMVKANVQGQFTPVAKGVEFYPSGDAATRSCLGTVGFNALLRCIQFMVGGETERWMQKDFVHAVQEGSELEQHTSNSMEDRARAFEEALRQVLSILNEAFGQIMVGVEVDPSNGEITIKAIVNPVGYGRDPIRVEYRLHAEYMPPRRKQTGQTIQRRIQNSQFCPLLCCMVEARCARWPSRPETRNPPGGVVRSDVDKCEASVWYLQLYFSERGVICTATTVRALLAMVRGNGEEVELILASVWDRALMYLTTNKNPILDLVEDMCRTLSWLVLSKASKLEMCWENYSCNWPHLPPSHYLHMKAKHGHGEAFVSLDPANHLLLTVRFSPFFGQLHQMPRPTGRPLGGIDMVSSAQYSYDREVEGDAGRDDDQLEIGGGDGGHGRDSEDGAGDNNSEDGGDSNDGDGDDQSENEDSDGSVGGDGDESANDKEVI